MDLQFIKKHEGLRLEAYPDPGTGKEPWTIGYGNTFYPPHINGGRKVRKGDVITMPQAEDMFRWTCNSFWARISAHIRQPLNDNQKTALLSFAYNIGVGGFIGSQVLRKVNANPNDPTIRDAFMNWINAGGKPILRGRRKAESDLYFKK